MIRKDRRATGSTNYVAFRLLHSACTSTQGHPGMNMTLIMKPLPRTDNAENSSHPGNFWQKKKKKKYIQKKAIMEEQNSRGAISPPKVTLTRLVTPSTPSNKCHAYERQALLNNSSHKLTRTVSLWQKPTDIDWNSRRFPGCRLPCRSKRRRSEAPPHDRSGMRTAPCSTLISSLWTNYIYREA